MHYIYIIRSLKDGSFYVGETSNLNDRLKRHNTPELNNGVTSRKIPWEYYHKIKVSNSKLAVKVERHIKNMKSRTYIKNLKKYPEISQKLIEKYS